MASSWRGRGDEGCAASPHCRGRGSAGHRHKQAGGQAEFASERKQVRGYQQQQLQGQVEASAQAAALPGQQLML